MNENPEGTPNPLNPVQGTAPVGQEPAPEAQPAGPAPEQPVEAPAVSPEPVVEQPIPAEQPLPAETPVEQPAEPASSEGFEAFESVASEQVTEAKPAVGPAVRPRPTGPVDVIKPAARTSQPMPEPLAKEAAPEPLSVETVSEQIAVEELGPESMMAKPQKKSNKTGLLIAIILLVVAIATGVAAAIILLNPFAKADAVPAAISKLMSGEVPKYIALDGTVNVTSNDATSLFTSMTVNFNSGIDSTNSASYANAKVMTTLTGGGEFDFDANEIHTAGGDLYLKLSNIYKELGDYYGPGPVLNEPRQLVGETNCVDGEDATNCVTTMEIDCVGGGDGTDCISTELVTPQQATGIGTTESLFDYLGVFDVIDDEWIHIPDSQFSNVTDLTAIEMPTQCLIDAASKLGQFGSDFANKYKQNPFINYSTDNLGIVKRANPLYRLTFDTDKLAKFINSMSNSGFMNELLACTGGQAVNTDINSSALSGIISALPAIYVEIDDNNNFTRVYLSITTPDGLTTATADIALSYPSSLNINEPSVYVDFNQVLSEMLTEFYGQPVVEITEITDITDTTDTTDTGADS